MSATILLVDDKPGARALVKLAHETEGCQVMVPDSVVRDEGEDHAALLAGIVSAVADAIIVTDDAKQITYVNAAAEHMFAASSSGLVGSDIATVLPFLRIGQMSGLVRCANGQLDMIDVSVGALVASSSKHRHVYVARDLSNREHQEEIEAVANRDAVTGLWNRRHFARDLHLRMAAALRYHTQGALLLIALDDAPGSVQAGSRAAFDWLAQLVAEGLRTSVRDSDIVARTSHTQFGVLLDHTGTQGAEQCAEKILRVLHGITLPEREPAIVSATIGITVFPDCARTPEHVLESAHSALGMAQREGGDRACVFVPTPRQLADRGN